MTEPKNNTETYEDKMLTAGRTLTPDGPAAPNDTRYVLLVGGLLLIISMTLGYLWQTERRRRIRFEKQAVEMKVELDALRARAAYAQKLNFPILRRPASRPSGG